MTNSEREIDIILASHGLPRPARGPRGYQEMLNQIKTTLGDHAGDYYVDRIADEILEEYEVVDIDQVPTDGYWAIVARHDINAGA